MTISNCYDSYWKEDDYDQIHKGLLYLQVKDLGYRVKSSSRKAEIVERLQRHHREIVRYHTCSDDELRTFINDRRLSRRAFHICRGAPEKYVRVRLIRVLENADDNVKFEKFLDLPPELRVRVSEFYGAEYAKTLEHPTRPPLARTCRLLQQEVSPVFYGNCEFEIHLKQDPKRPYQFVEDSMTRLFLLHLDAEDVASIRKLKVVVLRANPQVANSVAKRVAYHIELEKSEGRVKVDIEAPERDRLEWFTLASQNQIKNEILRRMDSLTMVNGRRQLRLQDIHGLRRAVESTVAFI